MTDTTEVILILALGLVLGWFWEELLSFKLGPLSILGGVGLVLYLLVT